jgi:hypothetical protein
MNVQPVPSAASANAAAQNGISSHFDAVLLQAAEAIRDAAPEGQNASSAKMQQALESAMAQLSPEPLVQPQGLNPRSQAATASPNSAEQTDSLGAAWTIQLGDLLGQSAARPKAGTVSEEVPGTIAEEPSIGGVQPGPQGGTPVSTASPADLFTGRTPSKTAAESAPAQAFSKTAQQSNAVPGNSVPSMAGPIAGLVPQSPVPSGTGSQGAQTGDAFPGGSRSTPIASTPLNLVGSLSQLSGGSAQPDARVLSVAVNAGPDPAAQPEAQVNGAQASSGGAGASAAQEQASQAQGQAGGTTPSTANQAPSGSVGAPSTQIGALPVFDMEVQLADASPALAILPDSQVTLKGDGTWVLPQGAPAQPKPEGQPASGAGTQAPQSSGTPAQQPVPVQADATPGAAPTAVAASAITEEPAAEGGGAAAGLQGTVQEQQAEGTGLPQGWQSAAGLSTDGTETTQTASQQSAQRATEGTQATQEAGGAWAQAAQLSDVVQAQTATAVQSRSASEAPAPSPGSGTQGGATVSAAISAANQDTRSQAGALSGQLASIGQNPGNAAAGQTGGAYGLQQNVAQQISQALNSAAGANPGRLTIQLKPASLGAVQVDLSMVDGKLTAHLVTSSQDVRDVLVRDLSGFKASLESHGVIVNEVSVAVRADVQDRQQGTPQQPTQDWWRNLARETAAQSAGSETAYAGSPALGAWQQSFSALA